MTFTLFENDKGDNDKRPDRKGTATINGVEYKLSGWLRVSEKTGKRYLRGKIEVAGDRTAKATVTTSTAKPALNPSVDNKDDVPF